MASTNGHGLPRGALRTTGSMFGCSGSFVWDVAGEGEDVLHVAGCDLLDLGVAPVGLVGLSLLWLVAGAGDRGRGRRVGLDLGRGRVSRAASVVCAPAGRVGGELVEIRDLGEGWILLLEASAMGQEGLGPIGLGVDAGGRENEEERVADLGRAGADLGEEVAAVEDDPRARVREAGAAPGSEKGASMSLQLVVLAMKCVEERVHSSSSRRGMISRLKMSRNE